MRILALDTATSACTVAVVDGESVLAELTLQVPRAHSTRLMPLVAQALKESGLDRRDLDAVAVGVGPGSFTGLRIGLATAKGLAFALDKPCVGVCTLKAMAYGTGAQEGLVVSLLDARRGQVYAGIYAAGGRDPAAWEELVGPSHLSLDRLAELLHRLRTERAVARGPVTVCGDVAVSYGPTLGLGDALRLAPPGAMLPRGWAVAMVGAADLARGRAVPPDALTPLYLKKSEAETLWEARRQASSP